MNRIPFFAAAGILLAACSSMPFGNSSNKDSSTAAPAASSSTASAPSAAPAAPPTPDKGKAFPGMNEKGEVIDAREVENGHGQQVKGLNDTDGEITGIPAPGTKFTQLQIGMGMKQVTDIAGQPSDQGAYMTGKAFIPFYFGSDRHRFELVYKGWGRLIFAGGGMGDFSSGRLIWIIHSAKEGGYR